MQVFFLKENNPTSYFCEYILLESPRFVAKYLCDQFLGSFKSNPLEISPSVSI